MTRFYTAIETQECELGVEVIATYKPAKEILEEVAAWLEAKLNDPSEVGETIYHYDERDEGEIVVYDAIHSEGHVMHEYAVLKLDADSPEESFARVRDDVLLEVICCNESEPSLDKYPVVETFPRPSDSDLGEFGTGRKE